MKSSEITVADYLITRLKEIGVGHLFGVPGDFVLGFFNQVLKSDLKYVGTCNELNAAYAADGYVRIRGVGAFSSTYGVGELSAINGVAGAFAERVPMVVITGSPSTISFRTRPLLHHTLGDYQIPLRIYEKNYCRLNRAGFGSNGACRDRPGVIGVPISSATGLHQYSIGRGDDAMPAPSGFSVPASPR
jgi:TPP-dependent 2-oxoacid decarboxylase